MSNLNRDETKTNKSSEQTMITAPVMPQGDFAEGERTMPPSPEGPDFARGERTVPPTPEGPDFARGERTEPPAPEGPDFARGQRIASQDKAVSSGQK
jgi:hypothetical protein